MAPEEKDRSVLLLDDDKFLLEMNSMKFTQQGFTVSTALSVHEALSLLRGGLQPDVILFDLVMPDQDGVVFIETVQKEKLAPRALKIALTNQYDDAERQKVLSLGADAFIVKASVVPSELIAMVEKQLVGRKHRV